MRLIKQSKAAAAAMYRGADVLERIRYPSAGQCFGVCWSWKDPSSLLERLSPDSDPNRLVTHAVPSGPAEAGGSPFDAFLPWKGMEEYNIIGGQVACKKGDPAFSRTAHDVMVYIPSFWYAVREDPAAQKRYYYVSARPGVGLTLHPGSGKFVGRYTNTAEAASVSRRPSEVGHTRNYFRGKIAEKGPGWSQLDIRVWSAVNLLYLVEYADWNAQRALGEGVSAGTRQDNGGTDALTRPSGHPALTAGLRAGQLPVQYRWIENWYGNLRQYLDGVNVYKGWVRITTDPARFADFTAEGGADAGVTLPASGGIKRLGLSQDFPWAFLPSESYEKGSQGCTEYIPDLVGSAGEGPSDSGGWAVVDVGGNWWSGTECGPWAFYAEGGTVYWPESSASRSVFDPVLAGIAP